MLGKLLPVFLAIIGVGVGIGAGLVLEPAPAPQAVDQVEQPADAANAKQAATAGKNAHGDSALPREYVKLNNQFIVPVVKEDRVESMVVLSLSVEVENGQSEAVYNLEPKLRDAFLQVLFDHANMGGFRGAFTSSDNMGVLRQSLNETAAKVAADLIHDVLIVEINRQDV